MSADLIKRLRNSLAEIYNPCECCHHAFKDRHSVLEDCPVTARINALVGEANEYLATQPKEPT